MNIDWASGQGPLRKGSLGFGRQKVADGKLVTNGLNDGWIIKRGRVHPKKGTNLQIAKPGENLQKGKREDKPNQQKNNHTGLGFLFL